MLKVCHMEGQDSKMMRRSIKWAGRAGSSNIQPKNIWLKLYVSRAGPELNIRTK